ncbi:hypothetical protein VTJ83DRAFT_7236 [Remersonia thermophila]|uniref:INO80 complex subunit 4 n=1 Tax=Remersonia thermophila TaxID=72144 RepID=A0ABR4D4F3_9PEZI
MAPPTKNATPVKDRRKSTNTVATATTTAAAAPSSTDETSKPNRIVTLKVPPTKLRAIIDPDSVVDDANKPSPSPANPNSGAENGDESAAPSPPASSMGPPADGPKKKGVKRSAGAAGVNGNGEPKVRGKPGPKKKQRLDDGTLEGGRGSLGPHKLGPKANQGAINAGLRALDRSGAPCRKWVKGGFTLKSFTGVVWEIPRWTAPPRVRPDEPGSATASAADSAAASEGSNKENNGVNGNVNGSGKGEEKVVNGDAQVKSEAVSEKADTEMQDTPNFSAVDSPAPVAIAA